MYIDKTQESTVQAFGIKKKREYCINLQMWYQFGILINCELYQTLFIYFYYNL